MTTAVVIQGFEDVVNIESTRFPTINGLFHLV
jgi:hypothetical protein